MKIYNYNDDGFFMFESIANKDPLEEDRFLIPAKATTVEPPEFDNQHIPKFNGVEWELVDISLELPSDVVPDEAIPKTKAQLLEEEIELLKAENISLKTVNDGLRISQERIQTALDDIILGGI